jgi:hypothetical protein
LRVNAKGLLAAMLQSHLLTTCSRLPPGKGPQYLGNRTRWPAGGTAGQCHKRP